MGYIIEADVRLKVWQVNENEVDDNIVNEAIAMAAADIDSALGTIYVTPFSTPVPEVVLAINNALLRYYGQFLTGHVFGNLNEPDQRAFDWAQAKLKALQGGSATIPGLAKKGNRVRCNTSGESPTFNRDDPNFWCEDQDMLDDIADRRAD